MRPFGYDLIPAYQLRPRMTLYTPTGPATVYNVTIATDDLPDGGSEIHLSAIKPRRRGDTHGNAGFDIFTDLIDPLQEMPVRIHR